MEIVREGPFPKVTIGGIFVGYGVPEDHPLRGNSPFSFLDDDKAVWYFVYEESVKPKTLSEAEMSAEFLEGILNFQDSDSMDTLLGFDERSPRTKRDCERMHTLSRLLHGVDCAEEGY